MALLTRFPSFSGRLRRRSQSSIILQFTWSRKRLRCIRLFEFTHGDGFESWGHSECGKWMDRGRFIFQVSVFRLAIEFPLQNCISAT